MKILHTADLHLGKTLNGYSLIEDQAYVIKQIEKIILDENIDTITIAGDIFDRAITTQESLDLFADFLGFVYKNNKHLIAILGNHDGERIAFLNNLLKNNNIHIVTEPERLKINGVSFYAIPYMNIHQFRDYYNEDFKNKNEAFEYVINDFNIKNDEFNYLIAHDFFRYNNTLPIESSSEVKDLVGGLNDVNAAIFDSFNYVALGHLHREQYVSKHNIIYSGSILKYSFQEKNDTKYVLIIDSNTNEVRRLELKPLKDLIEISGTVNELTTPKFYKQYNYNNDYFRVILDRSEADAYQRLKAIYPYLMEISIKEREAVREAERKIIENHDYLELFSLFYKETTNEVLDETNKEIIASYLKGVE